MDFICQIVFLIEGGYVSKLWTTHMGGSGSRKKMQERTFMVSVKVPLNKLIRWNTYLPDEVSVGPHSPKNDGLDSGAELEMGKLFWCREW